MALFFCPGIVLIYTMVKNAAPELWTFRTRQRQGPLPRMGYLLSQGACLSRLSSILT